MAFKEGLGLMGVPDPSFLALAPAALESTERPEFEVRRPTGPRVEGQTV